MKRILFCLALTIVVATVPLVQANPVILEVGLSDGSHFDYYENVLKPAFEERYPNVTVEFHNIGWGPDQYIVRYLGGTAPDVFQMGAGAMASVISMIEPLDALIERTGWEADLADFPAPMIEGARVNGQLLALPWNYATRTFTYRTDWFDEAGLDPDQPPTTWHELLEAGRALTRFDGEGAMVRQGFYVNDHYIKFAPWLFQSGTEFMNADLTEFTFADSSGMEAIEFIHGFFHSERISSRDLGTLRDGEAAMQYMVPAPFADPNNSIYYESDQIGVGLPMRHKAQAQIVMPSLWSINNESPNISVAWDWLRFVLDTETVIAASRELSLIPVRFSAAPHPPWSEDPRWHTTLDAVAMGKTVPMTSPYWNNMRQEYLQPALRAILYEGQPPSYLAEAQRQANAWLAEQLSQ